MARYEDKDDLAALIAARLPDNTSGLITPAALRLMFTDFKDSMGSWNTVDPANHGAKGDAVSLPNATVSNDGTYITHPHYTFKTADIGKSIWIYKSWQDNGEERTIASVSGGAAYPDTPFTVFGSRYCLFGTDDTLAIEAAFAYAETLMLDVAPTVNYGTGNGIPTAGTVLLRGGAGYIVRNTQTRYDAGKIGAVMIPRRCGLIGSGQGATAIYTAPGNVGWTIANKGAATLQSDEKITIANLSIYGLRDIQGAQCLGLINFSTTTGGGYSQVDNYSTFFNINMHGSRGVGFYAKGRGETFFYNMSVNFACDAGFKFDGLQDCRFMMCNAGGNYYAGFHVYSSASSEFLGCKSFYNGSNGLTAPENCCNWYVADQNHSYVLGTTMYIGCESQESRGSGWYIIGGLCLFSGCLTQDPKRFGVAPFPDVCAGIHLAKNGSNNVFSGFQIRPSLGLDYGSTTENHYGGDYAVYIEDNLNANAKLRGPRGNKGTIYTLEPTTYNVAKIGGPGTTNKLNPGLYIDNVPLPGEYPTAPTITDAMYSTTTSALIDLTAPSSFGRVLLQNYQIEFKAAGGEWTRVYGDVVNTVVNVPVTGLVAATVYALRVAAVTPQGQGPWSAEYAYTHSATAPRQVTGVKTLAGNGQVEISWLAPKNGGSAITDYVIEYKLNSSGSWTTFVDGVGTGLTRTLTGLTNDSLYDVRVSAVNAVGTGPVSATKSFTPRALMATYYDTSIIEMHDARVAASIVAANGTAIETWQDLSGNSYDMTQSTAAAKPSKGVKTINAVDVVSFDYSSTADSLNCNTAVRSLFPKGDYTLFFVYKLTATRLNQTQCLFNSSNNPFLLYLRGDQNDIITKSGSGGDCRLVGPLDTNTHVLMVRKTGSNLYLYLDGVQGSQVGAGTYDPSTSPSSLEFGRVNGGYGGLDAGVAHFSIYASSLSNAKANAIAADLQSAYAAQAYTNIT